MVQDASPLEWNPGICSIGSENANWGCRMTAWREGSTPGPELNFGMSNQFFVRDALGESVFLGPLSNVRNFFLFFCAKIDISRKKADSVGQGESRSAPTYRVRIEA